LTKRKPRLKHRDDSKKNKNASDKNWNTRNKNALFEKQKKRSADANTRPT